LYIAHHAAGRDFWTIQRRRWVDLIGLTKNPVEDIRSTRSIEAAYIAGNRVYSLH
jgi:hypothetical protein